MDGRRKMEKITLTLDIWNEIRGGLFVSEVSDLEANNLATNQLVKLPTGEIVSWLVFTSYKDEEGAVYKWVYFDKSGIQFVIWND